MEKHVAKEGMTFMRKADGYRMGDVLYMGDYIDGTPDVIDNYDQVEKTEEELEEDRVNKTYRTRAK